MQLCLAGGVLVLCCAGLLLPGTMAVYMSRYAGCYHNSICHPSACWSGGVTKTYFGYHKKPPFLKDAGLNWAACQSKAVAARKPYFAYTKPSYGDSDWCMLLDKPLESYNTANRPEIFECAKGPAAVGVFPQAEKDAAINSCACPVHKLHHRGETAGRTLAVYQVITPYPPLTTTAAAAPTSTTAPTLEDPKGWIDEVLANGDEYKGLVSPTRQCVVSGWACQKGLVRVINITATVGGKAVQKALQDNSKVTTETLIHAHCGDTLNHRFFFGILLHEGQHGELVVRAGSTLLPQSDGFGNFTVGTPCPDGMRNVAGPCNATTKSCPCADTASFALKGVGYCTSRRGLQLPRYHAYGLTDTVCRSKCATVSGCQGYAYGNRQCLVYGHTFTAGSVPAGWQFSKGNGATAGTPIGSSDGSNGVKCYIKGAQIYCVRDTFGKHTALNTALYTALYTALNTALYNTLFCWVCVPDACMPHAIRI